MRNDGDWNDDDGIEQKTACKQTKISRFGKTLAISVTSGTAAPFQKMSDTPSTILNRGNDEQVPIEPRISQLSAL
jgi:hypothetical protein